MAYIFFIGGFLFFWFVGAIIEAIFKTENFRGWMLPTGIIVFGFIAFFLWIIWMIISSL